MNDLQTLITGLGLTEHPEGGYFKETYRSQRSSSAALGRDIKVSRNLATSIYFLFPSDEVSCWHRLRSDEIWYFHCGAPLTVYLIDPAGTLTEFRLGLDLANGELPQVVIPAGSIFGARVNQPESFTLVGCVVAPGFDFADFELLDPEQLLVAHPEHEAVIKSLTVLNSC